MRKTTDQIKEDWLEDVEYGTLAPTIEVFDDEEFKEKLAEYNDAQSIKEMSVTRGWLVLKRLLIEEAERRMQDLIRCDEDDDEKLKKVKKEHLKAKHARDYITDLVENAKDVPRPVKQEVEQ